MEPNQFNFQEEPTMGFNLMEEEPTQAPGTFTVFADDKVIDTEVARVRAAKYDFAMGDGSAGRESIERALYAGSEDSLRLKAVSDENLRAYRLRQSIAEDLVRGKNGEPLSKQEQAIIQGLTNAEAQTYMQSPKTVLERLYATRMVDTANSIVLTGAHERLIAEGGSEEADRMSSTGIDIIAHKERAQRHLEDVNARWKTAGYASTVSNYAEQVVPFFSWWNYQNAIPSMGEARSFLPGNNLEEQVRHYYTLPLNQAEEVLARAVERMESANPLDAKNFLEAIISYSNTDKFVNNVFGVLDVATVAPIGTLAKATRATGTLMRDVVKVAAKPEVKASELLEAAGDKTAMAQQFFAEVAGKVEARAATEGQQATWNDMFGRLPLLSNPKAELESGELAKSAVFVQKLTDELTMSSAKMLDGVFVEPIRLEKLVPGTPAFDEAITEAVSRVGKQATEATDNFMFARPVREPFLSGAQYIDVTYGNKGGVPFTTEAEAVAKSKEFGFDSIGTVVPEGNGFSIRVRTGIQEVDGKIRSLMTPTDLPTPRDTKNLFMSWALSPNTLLSKDVVSDRAVAVYGINKLAEMGRTMLSEIKSGMSRKDWKGFNEFITKQRDFTSTVDGVTQRGRFSDGLAGFEMDWQKQFNRLPSEAEATAYFRYRQINDLEYAVHNATNLKNKTAEGITNIVLPWWSRSLAPKFEGRIVRDDPFAHPDPSNFIIWTGEGAGLELISSARAPRGMTIQKIKDRIAKEGLVPVQVTKEGEQMLRANYGLSKQLPDQRFQYIYVKNPKSEPLSINQVPYRPGGHVRLKDGHFISQPDITRVERASGAPVHYYSGDRNLTHFVSDSDARDFLPRLEKGRQMLIEGRAANDLAPLRAHLEKELGGAFTVEDFSNLFKKRGGGFDINTPFSIRATGSTIGDTENLGLKYANLKMGTDDVRSVAMQRMDPQYFKERGDILDTFAWSGSDHSPVLKRAQAELVDPFDTMEASFQSVIKSRYLDDLRVKVMERFVNEFAHVLDVPLEQLKANPWSHLLDPVYKAGAKKEDIQAAKNLRRTTLEFMGIRTPLEKEVAYVKQKLADSLYEKIGKDGLAKVEAGKELLDRASLGFTKDPVRFIRSLAFYEKMALYNPKQLFLQAQNFTSVVAIEGLERGAKAASAYYMHRGMMMNGTKEISDAMATMATKFGWKKEDILESYEAANRAGFYRVGGEHAYSDAVATPSINVSTFGKELDRSTVFFKEGERISRISAWNAAYLRWKELNPGKALTDNEIGKILSRADDLNGNMSRASNAAWQQGVFGIPTQFWGYQARLSELMLGKRLTVPEKTRMVAAYSLMYGLPTGAAVTGAGMVYPFQEGVRQYMLENGMAYDQGIVTRIMTEGIGGVANGIMFGEQTNFSETYSPQGLDILKKVLSGDKPMTELVMGVGGTTFRDNIKAAHPFLMAIGKVMGMDNGYDLTVRDFVDASASISSLSNASKAMHAYYTQQYWSKKETKLSDREVTAVQALLMGTTGVIPKHIADSYAMVASLKDRKAMQDELRVEIVKNLRLAYSSDTVDQADKYLRRAQIHIETAGFTPREMRQVMKTSYDNWEGSVDKLAYKYAQTSKDRMEDYLKRGR